MDKSEVCKDLYQQGYTVKEINKKTGIPEATIYYYIPKDIIRRRQMPSCQELIRLYIDEEMPIRKIAELLGHSPASINKWLKGCNIDTRKVGSNQHKEYTIEDAKKVFAKHGHNLLEEEYINVRAPMRFRCKCGNVSTMCLAVAKRGATCRKCAAVRGASKKKPTMDEVQRIFEERGCTLLSTKYIDAHKHLDYICHCGAEAKMTLANFRQGYDCHNCKRLAFKGVNNHNWNPELTDEERQELGRYEDSYGEWNQQVKRRDGFKCVVCGNSKSNNLCSHHLFSYAENVDKRTDVENGVCLCVDCHKEFHSLYGYGNNTKEQFEEFSNYKGVIQNDS